MQCAHSAGVAAQMVAFRTPTGSVKVLDKILERIQESTRFDCGLAYMADYAAGMLRVVTEIGLRHKDHEIRFDDQYLAAKVFRDRQPVVSVHLRAIPMFHK